MPANTTPATAIDIFLSTCLLPGGTPYTNDQDAKDGGTTPDLWYRVINDLTVTVGEDEIPVGACGVFWAYGVIPDVPPTSYNPQANGYYDPEGTALTLGTAYPNCPIPFSILAGEEIYFSCETIRNPTVAELHVWCAAHPAETPADTEPDLTLVNGQVFIPSASVFFDYYIERQGFIGGFVDPETEAIVNFIPFFICAEWGDTLADGTKAFVDRDRMLPDQPGSSEEYVGFYNQNYTFATKTIVDKGAVSSCLRTCWGLQQFVTMNNLTGALPNHWTVLNADGSIDSEGDTTGFGGVSAHCLGNDGNNVYFAGVGSSAVNAFSRIVKWKIAEAEGITWFAEMNGYRVNDILIIEDSGSDRWVVLYQNKNDPYDSILRVYDEVADEGELVGDLISEFAITIDEELNGTHSRLGYAFDMDYVWFLAHTALGFDVIRKINWHSGAYLYDFQVPNFLNNQIEQSDPPLIYISDTCPIIEVITDEPPPTGGSIIVSKIVEGGPEGVDFDFTTAGGLTPSTFSLEHNGIQSYSDLVPGTYEITETPDANYTTTYSVSNDDPHTAIEIVADEVINVIVTNTYIGPPTPNPLSGIYEVIPWKRDDTLWVSFDPEETEDVKIPRPYARTGLIGE